MFRKLIDATCSLSLLSRGITRLSSRQRRGELIEIIGKAIHELEMLAEHGKARERLNLLGGACKRIALVQTEQASAAWRCLIFPGGRDFQKLADEAARANPWGSDADAFERCEIWSS